MLARPTSLEHEPNPKEGGDDYDDDFIPDELVALSTDEDAQSWEGETFFSDVEDGEHVEKPKDEVVTTKKRKRREKEKQRKAKVCLHLLLC
jgi:protein CMS1